MREVSKRLDVEQNVRCGRKGTVVRRAAEAWEDAGPGCPDVPGAGA